MVPPLFRASGGRNLQRDLIDQLIVVRAATPGPVEGIQEQVGTQGKRRGCGNR
jgi:hypothetical protein